MIPSLVVSDALAEENNRRLLVSFSQNTSRGVSAQELVTVYQAADIIAVPSFNESFGLVALEAQASGTPVVATRVGGLPLTVAEGVSGVLVDGHDPEVGAHALEQLVLDDALRITMGAAAPAHAATYSWDATVEKMMAAYDRAFGDGTVETPVRIPHGIPMGLA